MVPIKTDLSERNLSTGVSRALYCVCVAAGGAVVLLPAVVRSGTASYKCHCVILIVENPLKSEDMSIAIVLIILYNTRAYIIYLQEYSRVCTGNPSRDMSAPCCVNGDRCQLFEVHNQ